MREFSSLSSSSQSWVLRIRNDSLSTLDENVLYVFDYSVSYRNQMVAAPAAVREGEGNKLFTMKARKINSKEVKKELLGALPFDACHIFSQSISPSAIERSTHCACVSTWHGMACMVWVWVHDKMRVQINSGQTNDKFQKCMLSTTTSTLRRKHRPEQKFVLQITWVNLSASRSGSYTTRRCTQFKLWIKFYDVRKRTSVDYYRFTLVASRAHTHSLTFGCYYVCICCVACMRSPKSIKRCDCVAIFPICSVRVMLWFSDGDKNEFTSIGMRYSGDDFILSFPFFSFDLFLMGLFSIIIFARKIVIFHFYRFIVAGGNNKMQ